MTKREALWLLHRASFHIADEACWSELAGDTDWSLACCVAVAMLADAEISVVLE